MFLSLVLLALLQSPGDVPIRVGDARVDPQDSSVTYSFVNTASDVTAYEVAITRHFSDGSVSVSTQGQDWFSSSGYTHLRAVYVGEDHTWLPPYPEATPGTHLHRLAPPAAKRLYLVDAEVVLTAMIRSDGTSFGDPKIIERFWSERRAILGEYKYWLQRLERARLTLAPLDALSWAVKALAVPRESEGLAGPREALHAGAKDMAALCEQHPSDASRLLEALVLSTTQQYHRLDEQFTAKR